MIILEKDEAKEVFGELYESEMLEDKCKECVRYIFCDGVLFAFTGVHLNEKEHSCIEFIKGTDRERIGYYNIKRKEEKWKKVLNCQTA